MSSLSQVTPQPRTSVPQDHPTLQDNKSNHTDSVRTVADSQTPRHSDTKVVPEPRERKHRSTHKPSTGTSDSNGSNTQATEYRLEKEKRHRSRERSTDKRESRAKQERLQVG